MYKDGGLTRYGWHFVIYLILALTTPINPFINHRYFNILWYAILALYALWTVTRIVYEEEEGA